MANTFNALIEITYNKGGAAVMRPESFSGNIAGDAFVEGVMVLQNGTYVNLELPEAIGTKGLLLIKNLSDTYDVKVNGYNPGTTIDLYILKPGEFAFFRCTPNMVGATGVGGTPTIEYLLLEA